MAPEDVGYYEKLGWRPCIRSEAELIGIAADSVQMSKGISRQPYEGAYA
jgi:hypothetical protein